MYESRDGGTSQTRAANDRDQLQAVLRMEMAYMKGESKLTHTARRMTLRDIDADIWSLSYQNRGNKGFVWA